MKISGKEIETMEEAMAAIGYLHSKYESEWKLADKLIKENDELLNEVEKTAWKLSRQVGRNKVFKSWIFGLAVGSVALIAYHVEKVSKLENRNAVLRAKLDKMEAEADDKFAEQLSE